MVHTACLVTNFRHASGGCKNIGSLIRHIYWPGQHALLACQPCFVPASTFLVQLDFFAKYCALSNLLFLDICGSTIDIYKKSAHHRQIK
jgi:hypothetical protein